MKHGRKKAASRLSPSHVSTFNKLRIDTHLAGVNEGNTYGTDRKSRSLQMFSFFKNIYNLLVSDQHTTSASRN